MPNIQAFLAGQQRFFRDSYEQFLRFGGPCVYFHRECLRAGCKGGFLSNRHIEMLYATLTAWGMHRMGETATKLTEWETFRKSIVSQKAKLRDFLEYRMISGMNGTSEDEYSEAIFALQPCYDRLNLSVSSASIVVNSKALHHLFPHFVPPVDRQYTIRFVEYPSDQWMNSNGKFKPVPLPRTQEEQFRLFHKSCVAIKHLADRVDGKLIDMEYMGHGVNIPKAMDNAIVNYVRLVAKAEPSEE